jgi:hypothetical protein
MEKAQSLLYKVFRGSMDKNMLKSFAIYIISCFYTNLRILSDYPDIFGKFLKEMRESVCLCEVFYLKGCNKIKACRNTC